MENKSRVALHVWLDMPAAQERDESVYYSVSDVDADDEEITCTFGSSSLARAWAYACERADETGVPAIEYATEAGTEKETDRYTPADSEEDC